MEAQRNNVILVIWHFHSLKIGSNIFWKQFKYSKAKQWKFQDPKASHEIMNSADAQWCFTANIVKYTFKVNFLEDLLYRYCWLVLGNDNIFVAHWKFEAIE